ncbi:MAG: FtsX-like permease family protein, partial [Candidatus Asgardarchaeia archaeon]
LEASLGYFISPSVVSGYLRNLRYNLLLVNLNETVLPILDRLYELKKSSEISILLKPIALAVFLEREEIVSIYDVDYFLEKLVDLEYKLNLILSPYDGNSFNYIRIVVEGYRNFATLLNFSFMVSSLPVLLIAVISTKTAAEISFNLRRREIGLLFVKGFKKGSVFIMFLLEATFIGIVTSFLGLLLGGFTIPYFVIPEFDLSLSLNNVSTDLIVLTVFVGLTFALISTFSPAIKASKLKIIDALKEYVYVEEVKPYKGKIPIVCFLLGSYKMLSWIFGFELEDAIAGLGRRNLILFLISRLLLFVDNVLNVFGPILFLYGSTKVFIQGSFKFQEFLMRLSHRIFGDMGDLATKDVRNHPIRYASIAFIIALVIGYTIPTAGNVASSRDFNERVVYTIVGADVGVYLSPYSNVSYDLWNISHVEGVDRATVVYKSVAECVGVSMNIMALDPYNWGDIAYHQEDWFYGSNLSEMLEEMRGDNYTIILEHNIANLFGLDVGDYIELRFSGALGEVRRDFRIVGFFGPVVSEESQYSISRGDVRMLQSYSSVFWSIIPLNSFHEIMDETEILPRSIEILVDIKDGVDSMEVCEEILQLKDVDYVLSSDYLISSLNENPRISGNMHLQNLGVILSIMISSIGLCSIVVISLRERERELALFYARGLSKTQAFLLMVGEYFGISIFSMVLGSFVGVMSYFQSIKSMNASLTGQLILVGYRLMFLDGTFLTDTFLVYILIVSSLMIPIFWFSRVIDRKIKVLR